MYMKGSVQNEPLCPDCGKLLELVESDETELDYNFFYYTKPCYGVCPKCGKSFRWLEIFDYRGVTGIEAIHHNEDENEDENELDAYHRTPDMMELNP